MGPTSPRVLPLGEYEPSDAAFCYITLARVNNYDRHHRTDSLAPLWEIAFGRRMQTAYMLMPNTHRRRRRDSTVELSRVGGVY